MRRWWLDVGLSVWLCAVGAVAVLAASAGNAALGQVPADAGAGAAVADAPASAPEGGGDRSGAQSPIEAAFANYLHFVLIGRFDVADQTFAQPLLKRPELDPLTDQAADELVMLTDKYEDSIDTLILVINNSTIGDNAKRILGLIREAQRRKRMDPSRIKENIKLLSGTPMQRTLALQRLIDSGEYAVPWMLDLLADPDREDLHAFVARALPKLGKKALNPLIEALAIEDQAVRALVTQMLGKIGYPQALPYLKRIAAADETSASIRESAARAIEQIVVADPRVKEKSPAQLFNELAEQYYAQADSLQPDPREDRANVWYFSQSEQIPRLNFQRKEVPTEIYNEVMCMRCSEASLALEPAQPATVALWLAANFRREARLGLDVESAEPADGDILDPTRPANFPRSIYFARSAGPACCQIVLSRAIKDRDRDVALGAIAALNATAGPQALVDPEDPNGMSLAGALRFPDLLVRIKAALALGRAMPQASFRGADEVIPVLASALSPIDKKFYMLVEPDRALGEQVQEGLVRAGATVVAADRLGPALSRARKELTHLEGIFLASDVERPTVIEAIQKLADDDRFALAPIVVFVKPGDTLIIDRIAEVDSRVGCVLMVGGEQGAGVDPQLVDQLLRKKEALARKFGYRELTPELSTSLGLEAAGTLRELAISGSPVFDVQAAEQALIEALRAHPSEDLRIASASVLALLDTAAAQPAIAAVALAADQTEPLRVATLATLAESARRFGPRLDQAMTGKLLEQAVREPNLTLRTAASRALGAMDLPGRPAAEIIIGRPAE